MSLRPQKEKYQSIPTTTYVKPVQIAPTVVLPIKVITEYSNLKPYEYKTSDNYNIIEEKTITTTTNNSNYYPHTIYYSNPQYGSSTNDNYSKIAYNTYVQSQPNQNNQGRKTVQYTYQQINGKNQPQILKYEFDQNPNNIIYNERKTNYPQNNNLNLNNIYNLNKDNKENPFNQNVNYEYFNNNMYIKESGNIINQKSNTQNKFQNNNIPNKTYNNPQQQTTTTKQINKSNNINKTNANYYNNINIKPKTNSNKNINNQPQINQNINIVNNKQHKTNINNQNHLYNNKIMTNKNITNTNNNIINNNISGNHNKIITNTNNKTLNYTVYEGIILQEPPDNKRKKKKNDNEYFNNTIPNSTINNEIKTELENNHKLITVERNSYPIQAISNFEISFPNNTANTSQNIFNNTHSVIKKNNIPPRINNINISNNNHNINSYSNNIQNIQIQDINNNKNIEYRDEFGNIYILINGQYVNKATLNQNKNVNISKNINTNTNIKIEKNSVIYKNKDNVYYEDNKNNNIKEQNESVNSPEFLDTYSNQILNNEKESNNNNSHLYKIKQEMILPNNNQYNDYLNNTYPIEGQKVYKTDNLLDNNNQNINDRNNRFREPENKDINIDLNNYNIIYNTDMNNQQQQQINNNILFKKTKSDVITDNNIQTVEPQKPQKRRPVYKIPPSKKRAVSQGKSLIFIHKYYDENFILEEDNEDNASDNENKKKQKNKVKNIFRGVTNTKKLIQQWQKEAENKNNSNTNINDINNNNLKIDEELNNLNLDKQNENNIENTDNVMRLSHIRFSLEGTNIIPDENKDINKENLDKNQVKIQNENIDDNQFKIENNEENEEEKIYCSIELNPQMPTADTLTQSNLSNYDEVLDSNMSCPRNSDSVIGSKTPVDNKTAKFENKNSDDLNKIPKNIDINSPTYTESLIKDSTTISSVSNFIGNQIINKKEDLINNNIIIDDEKKNININIKTNTENEKKTDEDERISLNIPDYDLDKYFEKEGINKRSIDQGEVSTSLKTINLEENRNSQVIVDNLEEEHKKSLINSSHSLKNSSQSDKLENSSNNNISRENSKDGSKLLMLEDAITGSVHIQENIQEFVKKNNELYNDMNK